MRLIYQRKNLQKSIPLMALMAAINVIIAELAGLSLIASLFLVLCLPLTSAIVELCCKDRYFPIYAIATFGLSLGLTFWNMETTIFYVLPSILTGYIFGLLAKRKIPAIWPIFLATLIQMGISLALIPFINFVFQVDLIMTFKTALGMKDMVNVDIIIPTFIFLISLIQVSLSQLIVSQELRKFGIEEKPNLLSDLIASLLGIVLSLFIILFYFVNLSVAYVLLAVAILFTINSITTIIVNKKFFYLIPIAAIPLLNVFLFALVQAQMKEASQILLISFSSICICAISCLFSFLQKKKEKIQ